MAEAADADCTSDVHSELIVANVPQEQGNLVCIQYPGFVDNIDRAITSLGGTDTITQVYYEKNHSLEARLRPEDKYCKPALARSVPVTNMVLRVRRRRWKKCKGGGEGEEEGEDQSVRVGGPGCHVEVLGLVKQNFEFTGMADYQVLPPGLSQVTYKADTVDPNSFQINEPFDDTFESSKVPLFLPPRTFSKFDKPSNYALRPDFQPKIAENQLAGKSRQRRQVFALSIPFDHKGPVPSQPHPDAPPSSQPKLETLKQLFEERPIWSRIGIQSRIKLHSVVIRSLLALVSYYFTSGPWKTLWVRLGYDPRSSPESKVYQCLDYRIPRDIAIVSTLESRKVKHRFMTAPHPPEKIQTFQFMGDKDSVELAEGRSMGQSSEPEGNPVYTADRLPSQRQTYYQLCDLREDTLQAIVHANDGREENCTVR
jgi:general transcription factor 3C polypeptide 5 (transcription factor C subunit 1)